MNLKTRYVVKGLGTEQTIESVVKIFTNSQGKIEKVEDKWGGKLPDNAFQNVSRPFSPRGFTRPRLISLSLLWCVARGEGNPRSSDFCRSSAS